jgi:hypothetical protein
VGIRCSACGRQFEILSPLRDIHVQPFLHNKESGMMGQISVRMHQLKVVVAYQLRHDLVDLQQREVAAEAKMAPSAKLHIVELGLSQ